MGPAGAGKSSVADYLVEKYGAKRYSFAGPLKQMVGRALEFTDEQLYGTQAQKEAPDPRYGGKSARWFLQRIGTEGCRNTFGQDFWTKQAIAMIEREAPTLAVIDDARFVNEAAAVQDFAAGYVVTLHSPNRETEADATHSSEQEWTKVEANYRIAPTERGLPLLFGLVDDMCRHYCLFPKRREVAL